MKSFRLASFVLFSLALGASGCTASSAAPVAQGDMVQAPAPSPTPTYVPGLGDLMTLIQQRHSKLYYAGMAGNWDLAQYELHELGEGLDDVMTYYAHFKTYNLTTLVPGYMNSPTAALQESIAAHDVGGFSKNYNSLTQSCTQCHGATAHAFIAIQVPSSTLEYSNLRYSPQ